MDRRHTTLAAAIGAGLAMGALSSIGRAHLDGTLDAFANSVSTWLAAPFLVGTPAPTRRRAAVAGLATCASQIVAYSFVDRLLGIATPASLIGCALWTGFGVALALLSSRGRVEQLRWLGLTVPLGS